MKNLSIALWAEYMKFRKSKIFFTTLEFLQLFL